MRWVGVALAGFLAREPAGLLAGEAADHKVVRTAGPAWSQPPPGFGNRTQPAAPAAPAVLSGPGVLRRPRQHSSVWPSLFVKDSLYYGVTGAPSKHHLPYVACVPYKNGHSKWMQALALADDGCPQRSFQDPGFKQCFAKRLANHPTPGVFVNRKDVTSFMVARNPLERALSGWLTWLPGQSQFNQVPPTFAQFVQKIETDHVYRQNPHWRPQVQSCDLAHLHYTYILHAEDRAGWIPQLVQKLKFENKAPFGPVFIGATTKQEAMADPGRVCPGYRCHASTVMRKYYTQNLVDRVLALYAQDVHQLGYASEVSQLRALLVTNATTSSIAAFLQGESCVC